MTPPLLGPDGIDRLREGLLTAGYTADGVMRRLDARCTAALHAGDLVLLHHQLTGDDPLAVLVRLFICGGVEPSAHVAAALRPARVGELVSAGVLKRAGGGLRAGVDLQPYGDNTMVQNDTPWWVVADLPSGTPTGGRAAAGSMRPLPADHVLGIGSASTTLALATMRQPVARALDIGTGCGIQALHLAGHAGTVTATDLSPRALAFAATTAALSGQSWELLAGDLARPVSGRRFDLVVSNPPFIVGPADRPQVTYRDSGRAGDQVCAELIRALPDLLVEGGHAQFLANWIHPADGGWAERLAGLLAGTGLDAWIVQREVSAPDDYVRMWLTDAGDSDPGRAARWLDWFDEQGIEAVGFGLVNLRAGGHRDPTVRIEDLRQQPAQPFGTLVADWFQRQDWLRGRPGAALLAERMRAAEPLLLETRSRRGPDGWAADQRRLSLAGGARWAEETDEFVAALVAGASGALTVAEQVALLAAAHGLEEAAVAEAAIPAVAGLVERGILLPA